MKTLVVVILATLGIVACGGSGPTGPSHLYPDEFVMDFPCTGDMVHVITCLDQGVFKENPQPETIGVGHIVMVTQTCEGSSERGRLGRVMGVETVDGQPGYRLGLDGTLQNPFHPDPFRECIIPHDAVKGSLIDVRWNVFPERVSLWWLVRGAKRGVKEAIARGYQNVSQVRAARDATRVRYIRKFEDYCDFLPTNRLEACSPTLEQALDLESIYAEYRRFRFVVSPWLSVETAELYWRCAYRAAENADYSGVQLGYFDCEYYDYTFRLGDDNLLGSAPCLAVSPEIYRRLKWHGPQCD